MVVVQTISLCVQVLHHTPLAMWNTNNTSRLLGELVLSVGPLQDATLRAEI